MNNTLPLHDDMLQVLRETLRTYVGSAHGRNELVRVLRRADDEALERRDELNNARAGVRAQMDRWQAEAVADGPSGPGF